MFYRVYGQVVSVISDQYLESWAGLVTKTRGVQHLINILDVTEILTKETPCGILVLPIFVGRFKRVRSTDDQRLHFVLA